MKVYDVVPGLEFDPERDFAQSPAWFLDGTHSVPPWTPMFGWFWINFCRHGMQYGAEKLSLPTVKGWDWRFMNGGGYLTLLLVKSEEEKQRREVEFRKAILPFIQDYDGLWNGFVKEILGRYEALEVTGSGQGHKHRAAGQFRRDHQHLPPHVGNPHVHDVRHVYGLHPL